jgi:acyl-CoA thioesterase-2
LIGQSGRTSAGAEVKDRAAQQQDHAAWFHRPARADEWLLQDVQSLVNAGGRGTLRGVIRDREGLVVASMAQEMLLRQITP